ncbi:hypothetical protein JY651_37075 [Pyxidicoccus parkwayensis]|uniref:Lipoprotein n=1 Tax=Pyxidicoccus parkwayensis TaxID=2813578 RepID=A0ABX7NPM8_9BACT|nr:hypothetical protein [Pyxidicoccus parkwaysis]QSQ20801.1 hypothetical protein JY651_37075 [Pyxidicoccus parkwaysis]
MSIRTWVVAAILSLSLPAAAQSRQYVDTSSYLTSEADLNAWYQLRANLNQNFDDVCGDTFCEGDYSNIQSLRFRCSVDNRTGVIGECVWVFAASNEEVDPATGAISVDAQSFTCRVPLAPRTTIQSLLAALAGPNPLRATLPRSTLSIYDGLADCL